MILSLILTICSIFLDVPACDLNYDVTQKKLSNGLYEIDIRFLSAPPSKFSTYYFTQNDELLSKTFFESNIVLKRGSYYVIVVESDNCNIRLDFEVI